VSLHENSESGEEEREREERRPCFSSECAPSSDAECALERDAGDDKVRRGICAARREDVGEGMVKVEDCIAAALSALGEGGG
jgi:hypothetical protein